MKVSTKGRYALRILVDLAINSKDNFISIAVPSDNNTNPMQHIKEMCSQIKSGDVNYYYVIIELSEEGQFFVK